jgi:DNA-binding NarL/FixJ family response regulator
LLIVDDHELARAGLRSILGGEADLEIVGEAANATEALALCEQLRPDLVLIDIRMPGQDGLETIGAIRTVSPAAKIIMITIHDDPQYVMWAISAGASGYVLKDATRHEMLDAVHRVLQGETVIDLKLTLQLVQQMVAMSNPPPLIEQLTAREMDVLLLIVQGQTNPEIADVLGIGKGTVKAHVQRIIAKLGVTDRTQAAVRAVQLGLVIPPHPPSDHEVG